MTNGNATYNCSHHTSQPCRENDIATATYIDITIRSIASITTTATTTTTVKKPPLISNETKVILEYIVQIGMFYTIAIFGIVVNIINIIVYKKQGLKDSITLGLFALSVSDLFVSLLPIETATCYVLKFIFPNSRVQFVSVHYVNSVWSRRMFYSLSCTFTAVLSLERCICVIFPFKVKSIFTKTTTAIILLCLIFIHVVSFIPIFATHQLRWQESPIHNGSHYLGLWFAPNRQIIVDFNLTLMTHTTPALAQAIVICCVVILIRALLQASKFRRSLTSAVVLSNEYKRNEATDELHRADSKKVLSPRDLRLVRSMVFIVAVLSLCNIPYLIVTYVVLFIKDLNFLGAYHNTHSLLYSISYVLISFNASLNFFVYYNTSTKYREIFDEMFTCRSSRTESKKSAV